MSSKDKDKAASGPGKRKVKRTKVMKDAPEAVKKTRGHHGVPTAAAAALRPQIILKDIKGARSTISYVAAETGRALREQNLFRQESTDAVVFIEPGTGKAKPMTKTKFTSWAEDHLDFGEWAWVTVPENLSEKAGPEKADGEDKPERKVMVFKKRSINPTEAEQILTSEQFRAALRPLSGVCDIRLPAWDDEKKMELRLLPPGYDERTRKFTTETVVWADDWSLEESLDFFQDLYKDFPFAINVLAGDLQRSDDGSHLRGNRSFSVQITAGLAAFTAELFALKVGFLWQSNQPGTGKSLLARMAIGPAFGKTAGTPFPSTEENVQKKLATAVIKQAPFIFFDNVRRQGLESESLENFMTSPEYSDRILGVSQDAEGRPGMVCMSGNGVTFIGDTERRFLVVELFADGEEPGEVREPLSMDWAAKRGRAKMCAALWGLLRHWGDVGRPLAPERERIKTYEEQTAFLGGVVTAAGLRSPLIPCDSVKDEKTEAVKITLRKVAQYLAEWCFAGTMPVEDAIKKIVFSDKDGKPSANLGMPEFIAVALECNVYDALELSTRGGEKGEKMSMGLKIKPYDKRKMAGPAKGLQFILKREASGTSRYQISLLEPEKWKAYIEAR